MLLRVDFDINDDSPVNALNSGIVRRYLFRKEDFITYIFILSAVFFLHEHRLAIQTDCIKSFQTFKLFFGSFCLTQPIHMVL